MENNLRFLPPAILRIFKDADLQRCPKGSWDTQIFCKLTPLPVRLKSNGLLKINLLFVEKVKTEKQEKVDTQVKVEAHGTSETEDSKVNVPPINPSRKRTPSLFEKAKRSMRLKKESATDYSDEPLEDD